jgi:hypothetical protein
MLQNPFLARILYSSKYTRKQGLVVFNDISFYDYWADDLFVLVLFLLATIQGLFGLT